jgi:imidazolonepropionase-like amidohydrolase
MLVTARRSLAQNLAAGVTLIRDAGDRHGVNTQMKAELSRQSGVRPTLRSPGVALRKTGRYGSFMAIEASDAASIVSALNRIAPTADDLKILLTGIIDFEKGCMKGDVQFSLADAQLVTSVARDLGKKTYAHCSGLEGLRIAVAAGVNSIEHGFFMSREILEAMAERQIAWVPTIGPVYFQWERPELSGWKPDTVARLEQILQNHFDHLALAAELGVSVVAGSDAGSYGVPHGRGLIDELFFLRRAGLTIEQVLAAATSVPRRLWGCQPADLTVGNLADLILLERSPFEELAALGQVRCTVRGQDCLPQRRAVQRAEHNMSTLIGS